MYIHMYERMYIYTYMYISMVICNYISEHSWFPVVQSAASINPTGIICIIFVIVGNAKLKLKKKYPGAANLNPT